MTLLPNLRPKIFAWAFLAIAALFVLLSVSACKTPLKLVASHNGDTLAVKADSAVDVTVKARPAKARTVHRKRPAKAEQAPAATQYFADSNAVVTRVVRTPCKRRHYPKHDTVVRTVTVFDTEGMTSLQQDYEAAMDSASVYKLKWADGQMDLAKSRLNLYLLGVVALILLGTVIYFACALLKHRREGRV